MREWWQVGGNPKMTLEAILTFFGILVAIYAIARPVQRHALELFVPLWPMILALVGATLCLAFRDLPLGWNPLGLETAAISFCLKVLDFVAFIGLALAALFSWWKWKQGKLTPNNRDKVAEKIFRVALRENQFDEVERFVRNNRVELATKSREVPVADLVAQSGAHRATSLQPADGGTDRHPLLTSLPAEATRVLFSQRIVDALVDSNSMLHLELLRDMHFLEKLQDQDRFDAVDTTLRALIRADSSPLRAAVVHQYGGMEGLHYSTTAKELIDATIRSPDWYIKANAHYPLLMAGLDHLRTGACDVHYNAVGDHYYASQGVSTRARCPIYLGFKAQVLAIEAAIERRIEQDLYVSDLRDLFQAILVRSKHGEAWDSPLASEEHPTVYAYLLWEITRDLYSLSEKAVRQAIATSPATAQSAIGLGLASTWSWCTARIANAKHEVIDSFRFKTIRRHLEFILSLKSQPSPISAARVAGLDIWADLYVSQLRSIPSSGVDWVTEAIDGLDSGKPYIANSKEWLRCELSDRSVLPG